jgi:hypothetical protein
MVLTNIVVTDPMIGLTITGNPIASVGASSSVIRNIHHNQADIDAKVVNTALATAKDPKGNDVTDVSVTAVNKQYTNHHPLTQNPSILIVKSATTENFNVGDILTYTKK